jgi:hypothetical protein
MLLTMAKLTLTCIQRSVPARPGKRVEEYFVPRVVPSERPCINEQLRQRHPVPFPGNDPPPPGTFPPGGLPPGFPG